MHHTDPDALLLDLARLFFARMPALAGVEIRTGSKRTCGKTHASMELMLYMDNQRELIPDTGTVYTREEGAEATP